MIPPERRSFAFVMVRVVITVYCINKTMLFSQNVLELESFFSSSGWVSAKELPENEFRIVTLRFGAPCDANKMIYYM